MEEFKVRRDAWHKAIESLGDPVAKRLPDNFIGQGIKEGYKYYKFLSVGHIYFYQVTNVAIREVHYEIFKTQVTGKRKEKRQMYPWEEPICDTIETFTSSGAANYRFGELLRSK